LVNLVNHFRGFKEKINKCLQDLYHQAKAVLQSEIDLNTQAIDEGSDEEEEPAQKEVVGPTAS
jgi:hypothetical protein